METRERTPVFVALIGFSSLTLVIGFVLFAITAQSVFLWWLAGLSVAIGVGALLGASKPSASQNKGFVAVVISLVAYGIVRIPVRLLLGRSVDPGHELEIVLYCLSLAVAFVAARWFARRGQSEGEAT
jgi:Na+-driven multidrug efflux pump